MQATMHDVIVVGAGIAGLVAATELARKELRVASIEASMFGGLVINVNELEGAVPGSGADLASDLMMELSDLGAATLTESVKSVEAADGVLRVATDAGVHLARAVVAATGARLRRLGVPGEDAFEHKGVSHCADCDGPMCQGQDVVVVGGGDSALQSALVLSGYAKSVVIVNRGSDFSARKNFVDAVAARDNVRAQHGAEVVEIEGDDAVRGVRARAGSTELRIPCAAVFVYIGLAPVSGWLKASVDRDAHGAVEADQALQTRTPGLYAVGAIRAGYGGTLEHAMAEGRAVAQAVMRQLAV